MIIYKITKPSDPLSIYIGQTKLTLKRRLQYHFSRKKREPHILLYKWLDNSCIIELIEEFESLEKDLVKEMQYVKEFEKLGFNLINTRKGNYTLNFEESIKIKSKKHNSKRHPNYCNWLAKIYYEAKKLGLTSADYKKQYNICEYNGPKKLTN